MALMSPRTWNDWVTQYAQSHQHPANRFCHLIGIPMIALSLPVFATAFFVRPGWLVATILFVIGWAFQFVGHAYERRPPEFLQDWRFLFVGLRWWLAKIRGRA